MIRNCGDPEERLEKIKALLEQAAVLTDIRSRTDPHLINPKPSSYGLTRAQMSSSGFIYFDYIFALISVPGLHDYMALGQKFIRFIFRKGLYTIVCIVPIYVCSSIFMSFGTQNLSVMAFVSYMSKFVGGLQ